MTAPFLALALLLGLAHLLGELARRVHQPAVVGEILAGVLLGPTVLGTLSPAAFDAIFRADETTLPFLSAMAGVAAALFMFVAGFEVDLSTVWRLGRAALAVGIAGMLVPFCIAFGLAWMFPDQLGREGGTGSLVFSLFFATAMSISALPVIARTLIDLGLSCTDFAMVVIAAAILQDLAGWIVFAVVLGLIRAPHASETSVGATIALTLAFTLITLTLVRVAVHRMLPWLLAKTTWPGGVIGFAVTLALLGAAATEAIGVHAILGCFLVGVAVGDSPHLGDRTRATLSEFVSFVFAPLFFTSIGLGVNFLTEFHAPTVLFVLAIACSTKIGGVLLGARFGGLGRREAWATAFSMNARGAVEVVLGVLALEAEIIGPRLFVALVVTAVLTSMAAGPLVTYSLASGRARRSTD